MPVVKIVHGDLLASGEKCIAQQCNCVTVKSHGLSAAIASKFPWADVYSMRSPKSANTAAQPSLPGTIAITASPDGETSVIHMFAQWAPGKPGAYERCYKPGPCPDTPEHRRQWFAQCLNEIDKLKLPRVAMPFRIGCGLAGGVWEMYLHMLNQATTPIVLYQQ